MTTPQFFFAAMAAPMFGVACAGAPSRVDAGAPQWRIVPQSALPGDVVVVKLFDDRTLPGVAGPVTTPEAVRRTLGTRLAEGKEPAARLAAGLPYFGYLWRGRQPAVAIDLAEAKRIAAEANVDLARDPVSGSLHAIQPGAWDLWIVDDEQLRMLRAEARSLGVDRVVLFVKR